MKYKVGDKVKIHSLDFFEKNFFYFSRERRFITPTGLHIVEQMLQYCGQILTISNFYFGSYNVIENIYNWDEHCFDEIPTERNKFTFIDFDVIIL